MQGSRRTSPVLPQLFMYKRGIRAFSCHQSDSLVYVVFVPYSFLVSDRNILQSDPTKNTSMMLSSNVDFWGPWIQQKFPPRSPRVLVRLSLVQLSPFLLAYCGAINKGKKSRGPDRPTKRGLAARGEGGAALRELASRGGRGLCTQGAS
jgi:hypothetical protein